MIEKKKKEEKKKKKKKNVVVYLCPVSSTCSVLLSELSIVSLVIYASSIASVVSQSAHSVRFFLPVFFEEKHGRRVLILLSY